MQVKTSSSKSSTYAIFPFLKTLICKEKEKKPGKNKDWILSALWVTGVHTFIFEWYEGNQPWPGYVAS